VWLDFPAWFMGAEGPAVHQAQGIALVVTHKLADSDDEGRLRPLSAEGGSGPAFTPGALDALMISYFSVPAAFGGGHGKIRGKTMKCGLCEPVLKYGPNTACGGNARKRA
jgi:hypothetical protein